MVFIKMTPAEKKLKISLYNYKWRLKHPNYQSEYYKKNKLYFSSWYKLNKNKAKASKDKLKYEYINVGFRHIN
jgi:hypothetical protein